MSVTRDDIVTVLGGVLELTPTPANPDTATPGAAWPRWVSTEFVGRLCNDAEISWDIMIVLPATYLPDTVAVADDLVPTVATALAQLGQVQTCEPVTIGFDDSTSAPGLRFRLVTD